MTAVDTQPDVLVFDSWRPFVHTETFLSMGCHRFTTELAVGYRVCPHGHHHFDPTISDRVVAQRAFLTLPTPCKHDECAEAVAAARKAGRT